MAPDPYDDESRGAGRKGEQDAWGAFGLVVSGVAVWGGAGYWLGRQLDSQVPVLVGLLLGTAGGLYLVWFRYGRQP
jgi:ATP synthase protein I